MNQIGVPITRTRILTMAELILPLDGVATILIINYLVSSTTRLLASSLASM